MAEENEAQEVNEEPEALEDAIGAEEGAPAAEDPETDDAAGAEGELDPLAEEMLRMMEEEGEEASDQSSQEDVDRMMEMEMLRAMEEEGGGSGAEAGAGLASTGPAEDQESGGLPPNVQRLMDVSMVVSIELGRTQMTLEGVMDLGEQSLVELDKTVGDSVDILVNGQPFARGEVVTVSESFGVRITELLNGAGR